MCGDVDFDFTRSAVVENQIFFLQSKCDVCGFLILASSVEDLLDQEDRHRTECVVIHRAA